MTDIENQIKCSDRQLSLFGLAVKELNSVEKPIINRIKTLEVHYDQLAGLALGKIWKLILEGNFNTKTLKMQIDRMWPTQIQAHDDLLRRALASTRFVDTAWGLEAIDVDFEIRSFHEIMQTWTKDYNAINKLKLTDDEKHVKWRKSCRDHLAKLQKVYGQTGTDNQTPKGSGVVDDMLKRLGKQI